MDLTPQNQWNEKYYTLFNEICILDVLMILVETTKLLTRIYELAMTIFKMD